jgi:phenylalanyl-tRNA synthetase alpha chain
MLHQNEHRILWFLYGTPKSVPLSDIAKSCHLGVDACRSALSGLGEKGFVKLHKSEKASERLTVEGEKFANEGFPEVRVVQKGMEGKSVSDLSSDERSIGISWAAKKGWVKIEAGKINVSERGKNEGAADIIGQAAKKLLSKEALLPGEEAVLAERGVLQQDVQTGVFAEISAEGAQLVSRLGEPTEEINTITREMLLSGTWKGRQLRAYDTGVSEEPEFGKRHVISELEVRVKEIFVSMGFEEMEGPAMESSFWVFDALFQPQDHPARDLADTFYLKGRANLPDEKLAERVAEAHEKGWKYSWQRAAAEKMVLRTHTTAVSAKYLFRECQNTLPKKYFSVGKVFRNEATDFKHLAEFYQVEGIVVGENANFCELLGCLSEFYKKLGFGKIRFRPSFFPYTEPSLEVEVFFEDRGEWMELGGAGIFRPEVSIPLCGRYPVLAWGLSLERPLMLLKGIGDIRSFYRNQVGWLRSEKARL